MKALASEMAAAYHPKEVESEWYQWWESSGFFRPRSDANAETTGKKFVIVSPPPNVTGYLHIGHALTGSVQDTVIRYHRMKGDDTLYLPGTDHAGIATQVVVEKRIQRELGKSRHDVGREEFLKHVWKFKEEHAGVITRQFREIGLSMDWTREHFTMDDHYVKAVVEAFVKMEEGGLIRRSTRLVNWCCTLQSAISDVEVDFVDVPKNGKLTIPDYDKKVDLGVLTHIAYKVEGSEEELIIATTRPETLLGDVAVAVHPEDERYKHLHGKRLQCPFREDTIPIVLDATLVVMEFGTGAVKITPAHDPNDFEAGERHGLPKITVLDTKGCISMEGPFHGMHRFDCRRAIVKKLEELGLLREVVPYEYRVGICSRTGDIIEPLLIPQWFVDCKSMAEKAVAAVRTKELRIYPESHESVWYHWLENIKPWCVSRQLWWGHRIPAYLVRGPIPKYHADPWVVARDLDEARRKAVAKFELTAEQGKELQFEQDPDVLDTWFSAAMWPYATMGWPNDTADLKAFFPGNLMETGHDILFFWVARMVMTSLYFTGKLPFSEVFLHAMVRDKNGDKMSKSSGNVIDPLYIINGITLEELHDTLRKSNVDEKSIPKALKLQKETFPKGIPECGSDALRFGLLAHTQSGRSVNLDIDRLVAYRQFCNKLWNVMRYVLYTALGESYTPTRLSFKSSEGASLPLECRWILSRLDTSVRECNVALSEGNYDFAMATTAAHRFWLYDLCDVFLELSKPTIQAGGERKDAVQDVLLCVVEKALRMLHPMMPFVTEELWQRLSAYFTFETKSIMMAKYPEEEGWINAKVEDDMKLILETAHCIRSMKSSYNLEKKHKPGVWLTTTSTETRNLLQSELFMITTLGATGEVGILTPEEESSIPKGCGFSSVTEDLELDMMLLGFIDVPKEIAKLNQQLDGLLKSNTKLEKNMALPNYMEKVPENVRAANDEKLAAGKLKEQQLLKGLERMKSFL